MLKKRNYVILLLIFATTLGVFISSCDVKNPTDGLEVRIKTLTRTSQINVTFIDGATGEDVDKDVHITFQGADKNEVISESNEPITTLTADDGSIIFALTDGLIPTENSPVKIIVVAEAEGYIKTSKSIVIRNPVASFDLVMTDVDNTPAGVSSTENNEGSVNNANDGVQSEVIVKTDAPAEGGGSATVTIPQGTTLLDASGNALRGNVVTRVTYYNPNEEQSLQSFPGGLNDITLRNQDGSEEENVAFVTAGFVSIDMEVNGTPVEGFGGEGIKIEIDVPAGTYNPAAERNVEVGDMIPLWSYDEDTGEWTEEGLGEVKNITLSGLKKSTSEKSVTISNVKHLSYWNLDWKDYANRCYTGKTVYFDGCFGRLYIKIKNSATGEYLKSYSQYINGASSYYRWVKFYNAPSNINVTMEFYKDYYASTLLGSANVGNLCEQTDFHIDMATVSNFRTVSIRLIARCTTSDPERVVYPEGKTIWYKTQSGGSWINAGQIDAQGYIDICLEEGVRYWFRSYIDGRYYYSYDYDDVPEMLEPGKDVYNFEVINPDVGDFCN